MSFLMVKHVYIHHKNVMTFCKNEEIKVLWKTWLVSPCFMACFSWRAGWTFSICFVRKSILRLKNAFESSTFYKGRSTQKQKLIVHSDQFHIITYKSEQKVKDEILYGIWRDKCVPFQHSSRSRHPLKHVPRHLIFQVRTSEKSSQGQTYI